MSSYITEPFAIVHNRTCPNIFQMSQDDYNFSINSKGLFTYWYEGKKFEEDVNNLESYCIEHAQTDSMDDYLFFMCFAENPEPEEKFDYTFYAMIASCVFLFLTMLIYVLLGETRKMFGKILVNYCFAMLIANAVLAYSNAGDIPTAQECRARGMILIFI